MTQRCYRKTEVGFERPLVGVALLLLMAAARPGVALAVEGSPALNTARASPSLERNETASRLLALNLAASGTHKAGASGFSFIKLSRTGRPLVDQRHSWRRGGNARAGTHWSCVRDDNTGLTWEVKTNDRGLRDKNWKYIWRPSTKIALSAAAQGKGFCGGTIGPNCDTATYIAAVNAINLCGYHDWRLPTEAELDTLVENKVDSPGPAIDTAWFPNAQKSDYWAAPTYPGGRAMAWNVKIDYGYGDYSPRKAYAYFVRLVRGSFE